MCDTLLDSRNGCGTNLTIGISQEAMEELDSRLNRKFNQFECEWRNKDIIIHMEPSGVRSAKSGERAASSLATCVCDKHISMDVLAKAFGSANNGDSVAEYTE